MSIPDTTGGPRGSMSTSPAGYPVTIVLLSDQYVSDLREGRAT
jgi:hypothetical protein